MKRVLALNGKELNDKTVTEFRFVMKTRHSSLMEDELSGEEAKNFAKEISLHHRVSGSSGFHEAVEYTRWMLEKFGLKVSIDTRPLDGEFKIWTWTFPRAWDIVSAELEVVEPEPETITTFDETAVCVYKYSAQTPSEGIEAELVYVGEGTEESCYEGTDVGGKIVLARGSGQEVATLAMRKFGAVCVITDFLRPHPPVKTRLGTPDLVQDASIRGGDMDLRAYSVSYNQFKRLKELLERGPVKLRITINAFFVEPGVLETVIAQIPGSTLPNEEVVVIPHLCHYRPGANDNAAGVGLVMEVAKVIKQAIDSGRIERPKRTITFILGAEMYGSLSYLERNWDRRKEIVGGFCLDMLGENQEKTKAGVEVSSIPDSLPNFLNDHVATLFEWVRRKALYREHNANRCYKYDSLTVNFRYNISQFTPGSDHLIFDDSSVDIPVIQFGHWPDIYYHSSGDIIEMVDPEELKRNGLVFGTALLNLANAGAEQVVVFMNHVYTQSLKRLADNGGRVRDEAITIQQEWEQKGGNPDELAKAMRDLLELEEKRLGFLANRDRKGLRSALRLLDKMDEETQLADSLCVKIDEALKQEKGALRAFLSALLKREGLEMASTEGKVAETEFMSIVPKRRFVGSLSSGDFMRRLSPERMKQYREWAASGREIVFGNLNAKIVEMWSFSDGVRSIADIAEAVTFEYGFTEPKLVLEIFKDLKEIGYVDL